MNRHCSSIRCGIRQDAVSEQRQQNLKVARMCAPALTIDRCRADSPTYESPRLEGGSYLVRSSGTVCCCGLTSVTQTLHKEKMKNPKRNPYTPCGRFAARSFEPIGHICVPLTLLRLRITSNPDKIRLSSSVRRSAVERAFIRPQLPSPNERGVLAEQLQVQTERP